MIESYVNQEVILDVSGSLLYLGVLKTVDSEWLELSPVDVHDILDGKSNKESYIRESSKNGIRYNRNSCYIARNQLLSISLLKEIIEFPS